MKYGVAAGLALLSFASAAQAQVRSTDAQSIARAMQDAGYKAELTKGDDGDPLIRSGVGGYKFTIFFYNCTDHKNCADIQFYIGWTDKFSIERANEWNRTHRFGRAYSDKDGEAALEYDVNFEDQALPLPLFKKDLDLWSSLVDSFSEFVTEKQDAAKK